MHLIALTVIDVYTYVLVDMHVFPTPAHWEDLEISTPNIQDGILQWKEPELLGGNGWF